MGVGTQSDRGRPLFNSFERVFDLVQTALWRPSRDIVIVLVAELAIVQIRFHPKTSNIDVSKKGQGRESGSI
jgi:hypothetical protein